jgi:hypothetical protein
MSLNLVLKYQKLQVADCEVQDCFYPVSGFRSLLSALLTIPCIITTN